MCRDSIDNSRSTSHNMFSVQHTQQADALADCDAHQLHMCSRTSSTLAPLNARDDRASSRSSSLIDIFANAIAMQLFEHSHGKRTDHRGTPVPSRHATPPTPLTCRSGDVCDIPDMWVGLQMVFDQRRYAESARRIGLIFVLEIVLSVLHTYLVVVDSS